MIFIKRYRNRLAPGKPLFYNNRTFIAGSSSVPAFSFTLFSWQAHWLIKKLKLLCVKRIWRWRGPFSSYLAKTKMFANEFCLISNVLRVTQKYSSSTILQSCFRRGILYNSSVGGNHQYKSFLKMSFIAWYFMLKMH